ncbi:MAG: PQQ-dependent dehydrogenase, methanol/ethanol family [Sphingomonadales bacterium]|nr:PQQ-dependent dehydrogenase, methanol/ethanol family [Sphingomonadales bacterium]
MKGTQLKRMGGLLAGAALLLGAAPLKPVGSGEEWHGVNGDSAETGFSRLAQIDTANAGRLGLAWFLDLPGEATLQSSPIMVDGTLYFTGSYAGVYAVDARTGQLKWKFEPKVWEHNPFKMNFGFSANRGVVYANGKLFSAALDGRVFALDAKTGAKLWEAESTDPKGMQTVTGAPRVIGDKVIIGNAGADFGQRGYVSAYDVNTGRQVWKTYVVPGNPEGDKDNPALVAAAKTWEPGFWKKTGMTGPNGGGGGPWDSMTWDEELGRVYIGTANAYDYDPDKRDASGGDNLYTASILALDVNTGKYIWHYQLNPRDSWDYDATQQIVLATLKIGGKARKVLMQAPKNGFFYVIDRVTGKPLSAGAISKINWADRIDMKTGRPVERPNIRYQTGAFTVYPFSGGAHSWMRMAYSPATGLVYVPTMQQGTRFFRGEPAGDEMKVGGLVVGDAKVEPGDGKGTLVAYDPVAAKVRWKVEDATLFNGGTAVTAGNVVFQGTADGWFHAYDARDGKELWKRYLGMGIIAAPSTWSVDGRQYVSILAGYGGSVAAQGGAAIVGWKYAMPRRLFTFALDGKAAMPADLPQPTLKVAALDNPDEVLDPKQVAMGKAMFMACGACHGKGAIGAGGPAPDLRESPIPLDAAAFYTVVHDGALIEKGMPRFAFFGKPQIEAIRQYVRSKAREALAAK